MVVLVVLLLIVTAVLGYLLWKNRKSVTLEASTLDLGGALQRQASALNTQHQQAVAASQKQLGEYVKQIRDLQQKLSAKQEQHALELQGREAQHIQALASAKHTLELEFEQKKRTIREQSNERSRPMLLAKVAEHFTPMLSDFPYGLKDSRHIGELFDFLVYDGLEEGLVRNVVFLEVKTGTSYQSRQLNPREKLLRDAIDGGRVKYEVFVPKLPKGGD